MSFIQFVRRLIRYASYRIIVILAAMLAGSLLEGAAVGLLVPILDLVQNQKATGSSAALLAAGLHAVGLQLTLLNGLTLFLGLFVVQSALTRWREATIASTLADFQTELRDKLYKALFGSRWTYFVRQKKGELVSVFMLEIERSGRAFHRLMQIGVGAITAAIYMSIALAISWSFTLVMLASMLVLAWAFRGLIGRGGDVGRETSRVSASYHGLLSEHLDTAKVIRGSGIEALTARYAHESARAVAEVERCSLTHSATIRSILQPVAVAMLCAGIYLAVTAFGMGLASVTVVLFIFFRVFPQVTLLQTQFYELLLVIPAFARVESLLAETGGVQESRTGAKRPPHNLGSGLTFQTVSYSYVARTAVLDGVSLHIGPGETVALVGGSGAGKSTVVDLALGLLRPDGGAVLLDGEPLDSFDIQAWRSHVAYVTQETVLVHDTVRANIAWGLEPQLSLQEIQRVAALANAAEFIERLPNGYDTIIGDRGALLSGGQRQRLALARALARSPRLLILDEATSALDAEAEAQVYAALENLSGRLTILIIAHRFSTLRRADRIYVLESGRVVESGTREELHALNGRFTQLELLQAI